MKMNWKRKLIILAVPAALAVGGGAFVVGHAATTPNPTPGNSQTKDPAENATESGDTTESGATTEAADPAEAPGAAGTQSGHADPAGNVDHPFDGEE